MEKILNLCKSNSFSFEDGQYNEVVSTVLPHFASARDTSVFSGIASVQITVQCRTLNHMND